MMITHSQTTGGDDDDGAGGAKRRAGGGSYDARLNENSMARWGARPFRKGGQRTKLCCACTVRAVGGVAGCCCATGDGCTGKLDPSRGPTLYTTSSPLHSHAHHFYACVMEPRVEYIVFDGLDHGPRFCSTAPTKASREQGRRTDRHGTRSLTKAARGGSERGPISSSCC